MPNPKKILIVDDDNGSRLMTRRVLSVEGGYDIREVQDGHQVQEVLNDFQPDLMILDIRMPNKDGSAICQEIRAKDKYKDMKIVAVSAEPIEVGEDFVKKYKADKFIMKPFNSEELKGTISCLLLGKEGNET